jgi:hypothetical protein
MAKRTPEVVVTENRDVNSLLELDPDTLDATRHYRWIRESPLNVGKAKMKGYTLVNAADGVKTMTGFTDDTGDGLMRIGDVILMSCPLDAWRARKRASLNFANARLSAPAKQFKKNARRRQVRILNEEDE